MSTLSKETQDQIRKEADDKYPIQNDNDRPKGSQNDYSEAQQDFDNHNAAMSMMQDAHIEAATAWAIWKQKAEGLVAVTEALLDQYKMACRDFCRKDNLEFIESDYPSIVNATKAIEQFKQ